MSYLSRREIKSIEPDTPSYETTALERARNVAKRIGIWSHNQQFGSRWSIGCVALEITQRCNLDCTLCYLSDHSEAVHDLPLTEIFRRLDMIRDTYGAKTDVQITGGDPTLRKRSELVDIVRYARAKELRPTLMTNGIKATRDLLAELSHAGLSDVAFHVDTTQQRKGYYNESDLNSVRNAYIRRAQGLGMSVFFNTTVHAGNLDEVPQLVRFFRKHADVVSLASFQIQADTGRGTWRRRDAGVTADAVARGIEFGAASPVSFNGIDIGHPDCSRFAMCLAINGNLYDLLDDRCLAGQIQQSTAHIEWNRARPTATAAACLKWLLAHPMIAVRLLDKMRHKLPTMIRDLVASRFRVRKLSFIIHDFMDECTLDPDRIEACVFKNMTGDGPLSMCLCNAKRDDYLLAPVEVIDGRSSRYWNPLDGRLYAQPPNLSNCDPMQLPLKRLKGRARRAVIDGTVSSGVDSPRLRISK